MKKIFLLPLMLVFISVESGICNEPEFQETSSEMIQSLTSRPAARTRGIARTRSFSPSPTCRAIVVKEKIDNQRVEKTITVNPDQPEPRANLKIEFDVNSYRIRPEAYPLLKELGMALTSDELCDKQFYINGHTDDDGPAMYNLDLSLDRAQSVKDFLVGNFNIPSNRLKVMGYGEALPLVENSTSMNKQANRRVEVKPVQ